MANATNILSEFGQSPIDRINHSLIALNEGKPVILIDDENRENEGDIIYAAEKITPQAMNFLIRNCTGIVCLCLTKKDIERLQLDMMVPEAKNTCKLGTAFTVSIDAKYGTTTGVSAADRTNTILTAIDDNIQPDALARPGHIFPLYAKDGGVLNRAGHTEGSIDLMQIAGLKPAAVLCELMNPDGSMSKLDEIILFARKHHLIVVSIEDIIFYRKTNKI